jgi:hypothetical protein
MTSAICTNCGLDPSALLVYRLPGCCARCGFLPIDRGLTQVSNRGFGSIATALPIDLPGFRAHWRGDASALAAPLFLPAS